MHIRYRLVAAWVLATIASILVAFAAVASVRTAIADPPSALRLPDSTQPPIELPPLSETQQTTMPDPEVGDGAPFASVDESLGHGEPAPTDDTEREMATTTQASVVSSTSVEESASTTAAPTTSTSQSPTTQPPVERVERYETEGGWVTFRANEQGVFLDSASPKPGWTVKTEGSGPDHFTVVFEGDEREVHVKVEFEHGEVDVEIED